MEAFEQRFYLLYQIILIFNSKSDKSLTIRWLQPTMQYHVMVGGKDSGSEQKAISECLLTNTKGELYLWES